MAPVAGAWSGPPCLAGDGDEGRCGFRRRHGRGDSPARKGRGGLVLPEPRG